MSDNISSVITSYSSRAHYSQSIPFPTPAKWITQNSSTQLRKESHALIPVRAPTSDQYLGTMDSDSSNVDLSMISKLSDKDKQELQSFIQNESQKARIQQCEPIPLSPSRARSPLPSFEDMPSKYLKENKMLTECIIAVHNLTDICWKKCVTGSIRSGKLERGEESCTQSCVDRFLDSNFLVIKHLESMRTQS